MNLDQSILSDIMVFMKYAKHKPELERRETWHEIVDRNKNMHIKKYPALEGEINKAYGFVFEKKVLPSMRSLQFAGRPIELNEARIYNCSYAPVDSIDVFSEIMFLLLSGVGCGFSVQSNHVEKLPEVQKPFKRKRKYVVGDSIEGWADAIKVLVKSYFGENKSVVDFDFSDIRPKGAMLVTSGGKAPGPEPLIRCVNEIKLILERKENGQRLTSLECHDIVCRIADAVLAGGIRRAALISLFDQDDEDMLYCKFGTWYETNPQRGRSNNSAVLVRHKATKEVFDSLWSKVKGSGSGEPGIYFTNNAEWGTNPSLRAGTKIITSDGIFPIEKLEDSEFQIPNLNGEWKSAKCWKSGKNIPLWKLDFDDGTTYYASPQHEWPVFVNGRYVKVSSDKLKKGDLMPINKFNREKLFNGKIGTRELGFMIGWLYGDGSLTKRNDTEKYVASFIVSKKEADCVLDKLLNTIKQIDDVERKVYERKSSYEFQVGSKKFISLLMDEYGVNKKEFGLPSKLWTDWSDEMIRGFIDGLFSSDGHVPKDSHGLSLTSSHEKLIKETQELLGFYGIKTSLTSKTVSSPRFPNGTMYNKKYTSHILRTTVLGRKLFSNLFSLSIKEKQKELNRDLTTQRDIETLKSKHMILKSIELTNLKEDVWDVSVFDETHCFQLSTVTTGNCCEIALRPYQFCNLVEINGSTIESLDDFLERATAASYIATLQASYTNFHYLRDIWRETTEKDALIGVGITGIASNSIDPEWLSSASKVVKIINETVAKQIGINPAARTTTVKPSGTSSLVVGSSSGIHAWHDEYYIRRIRVGKNESIYTYLSIYHPELLEDDLFNPAGAIISVPQKAPEGALLRGESAIDFLERVKTYNIGWVRNGHRKGDNTNNVSATVSIKEDEWNEVGEWMWENRNHYNGLSVLPFDNGSYVQAPFESITEEEYLERIQTLHSIDLSKVVELTDNTKLTDELACAGPEGCEVK